MKKIFFYYLVLILSTTTATAQINQGGIPSSFGIFEMKDVPTVQIEKPNMEQIELEDAVDAKQETSISMVDQYIQMLMLLETV